MQKNILGRIVICTLDKTIAEQINKGTGGRKYGPGEQVAGFVCGMQGNNLNAYLYPDGGGGPIYATALTFAETGAPRTWNWPEGAGEVAA